MSNLQKTKNGSKKKENTTHTHTHKAHVSMKKWGTGILGVLLFFI